MIHYHGGPITPETCALTAWKGRHACVSFAHTEQIALASEITQSWFIDNGAFTFWKKESEVNRDWSDYYKFLENWINHPRLDFAVIPDVIDQGEAANDKLLDEWPGEYKDKGVPVWHMNESDDRFIRLCNEYPRVAIGSCGEYDVSSPRKAVTKLKDVIRHVVDKNGYPITKLHGMRMLNKSVFKHIPLSSADSTNVARNIGIDKNWSKGNYQPTSKATRAYVMVERIESVNSASQLIYNEATDKVSIQMAFEI